MIINCPNCDISIEILALNCKIFRCGILKSTYLQIGPHTDKQTCDYLKEKDLIYGCGKPFMIVDNKAVTCDYI